MSEPTLFPTYKPIRPPYLWYGGKASLCKRIAALLPEHRVYYELMVGSGAVFFSAPPAERSLLNDINPLAHNLLTVIRDQPAALLASIPAEVTRDVWFEAQSNVWAALPAGELFTREQQDAARGLTPQTGVALAASTYICGCASFNGRMYGARTGDTWYSAKMAAQIPNRLKLIQPASARLQGVSIENRDAFELIEEHAAEPDALFFLDPPYMFPEDGGGSRKYRATYGPGEPESPQWHERLLDLCSTVRGAIVLTSGDDETYRRMCAEHGWRLVHRREKVGSGNDKARWNAAHLVWMRDARPPLHKCQGGRA